MAPSIRKLKEMLKDIILATASKGLTINEGKTVVLTNADVTALRQLPPSLSIEGRTFQVSGPMGTAKWLAGKFDSTTRRSWSLAAALLPHGLLSQSIKKNSPAEDSG